MEKEELKEEVKKEKKSKKTKELDLMIEKNKFLEEEILRAKADLINYRKRKDEEVSNLLKYSNADILISFLPIIDNFERALNKKVDDEETKSYLEGFRLIYNGILEIFASNEVTEIDALGKEFDPMYHQSVSMRKDETKESGIILEVFQKGYMYKDKVIRPAMVIINE